MTDCLCVFRRPLREPERAERQRCDGAPEWPHAVLGAAAETLRHPHWQCARRAAVRVRRLSHGRFLRRCVCSLQNHVIFRSPHVLLTLSLSKHVFCSENPAGMTLLHARDLPPSGGGDTLFIDMVAAFSNLSQETVDHCEYTHLLAMYWLVLRDCVWLQCAGERPSTHTTTAMRSLRGPPPHPGRMMH